MRIIGGKWRGKPLLPPKNDDIRPTTDRTREAVFNVIVHRVGWPPLQGATVIDGFCGTGAFALECLSRGAVHAVAIDKVQASLALVRRNAERLGAAVETVQADMTLLPPCRFPPATHAYLDPPYRMDLASPALAALHTGGWLATDAIAMVEQSRHEPLPETEGFETIEAREYGNTRITFLRHR